MSVYTEDELLPLSALQHLLFCERQCALIHIEGLWAENRLTVEGGHLHRRAHEAGDEIRGSVRTARSLALRSLRLGLSGVADVVEFQGSGVGRRLFPVEYKRGAPKSHDADRVQLCAQALCLEEMLGVDVRAGALFYGETRRRLDVMFDGELRRLTEVTATRLHILIGAGVTPRAQREPKCDSCSLIHLCLPDAYRPRRSASDYVRRALARSLAGLPEEDAGA